MCLPNKSWAGGQLTEEDIDFKLNECKSREEFIDMIERYVKFYNRQRPSYALGYDTPDNYIGIYSGASSTAPTAYTSYTWFKYKGEKGDIGTPATITSQAVEY